MVKGKRQLGVNTQTGELKIIREGKDNIELIFNFIFDNRSTGARPRDIKKNTGLSKQTVNKHLQLLFKEKRIYKKDRKYYSDISIQNSIVSFANLMRDGAFLLIDKMSMESDPDANLPYELGKYPRLKLHQKIKVDIPEKLTMPIDFQHAPFLINSSMYLMKMMLGPVAAEKYCRTSFGPKESLQRCLFEFANRIGAYITYILLQSLHPLQEPKLTDNDRGELCNKMLEKAINVQDLLSHFKYLINDLGLTGCNPDSNEYEKLFQLSENNFKTISKGLQNVYPNIYIGLENFCLHASLNNLVLDTVILSPTCDHHWEKRNAFKYGSFYYCTKCHKSSLKMTKKKS